MFFPLLFSICIMSLWYHCYGGRQKLACHLSLLLNFLFNFSSSLFLLSDLAPWFGLKLVCLLFTDINTSCIPNDSQWLSIIIVFVFFPHIHHLPSPFIPLCYNFVPFLVAILSFLFSFFPFLCSVCLPQCFSVILPPLYLCTFPFRCHDFFQLCPFTSAAVWGVKAKTTFLSSQIYTLTFCSPQSLSLCICNLPLKGEAFAPH